MKEVEFYRWWLPATRMSKSHLSRWTMDEEYALKHYPGAVKDAASREVRKIAETDQERASFGTSLHAMIKPENAGRHPSND